MYSREQAKLIKQEFWTTFGQWSLKKRRSQGKGKWLLNRTGVKGFRFKFETNRKSLNVCLEIIDSDETVRNIKYEKLLMLKPIFDEAMDHALVWDQHYPLTPDKTICRIYITKQGLTPNNRQHWQEIFAFFYQSMNRMETLFEEYKEILDE